ncbi:MAG TPA: formate/nitrite transporter family protein [Myxococcaceae bacterium]|nr:formate/nitrite transporter family protein [Myxococcaceae bacterium]
MPIWEKSFPLSSARKGRSETPSLRYRRVVDPSGEELRRLKEEGLLVESLREQLQQLDLSPGVVVVDGQVLLRMDTPSLRAEDGGLRWARVDVVVQEGTALTVEPREVSVVEQALERFGHLEERVGSGQLLALLAEEWVSAFERVRGGLERELASLQEPGFLSLSGMEGATGKVRQELAELGRGLGAARECLETLTRGEVPRLEPEALAELQAARDRLRTVSAGVEGLREWLEAISARLAHLGAELGAESPEVVEVARAMGERRLRRLTLAHALTALVGGLAVSFGAMAMAWTGGPWLGTLGYERAHLVGSLAFPIGFVILVVGKGELFTENFFVPVTGVVARRGKVRELLWLWGSTLAFNLVGGAVFSLLASWPGVLTGGADAFLLELAAHKKADAWGAAFTKGVFAGWLMTVLTWLLLAARGQGVRLFILWIVGFLIAAGHFNHVVISAAELFMAMGLGSPLTVEEWLRVNFLPALLGNLVGGLVFVTLLGSVQAHSLKRSEQALKESLERRREASS